MTDSKIFTLVLILSVVFAESILFPILIILLVGVVNAVADGLSLSIVSVQTTVYIVGWWVCSTLLNLTDLEIIHICI